MTTAVTSVKHSDVVLIGAGIMSATLAVILKELDPAIVGFKGGACHPSQSTMEIPLEQTSPTSHRTHRHTRVQKELAGLAVCFNTPDLATHL
jgi:hypothetical protein